MKKKIIVFVFALLLAGAFLWADSQVSNDYPWTIHGFIVEKAVFTVSLNTSYPQPLFDIDDPQAYKNNRTDIVRGIFAGLYSLVCNVEKGFSLTVKHDMLVNEKNNQSKIDYRLDVFDSSETGFISAYADEEAKPLAMEQLSGDESGGTWGMKDKAFYVSLWWPDVQDQDDTIAKLAPGLYTSTITFTLSSN